VDCFALWNATPARVRAGRLTKAFRRNTRARPTESDRPRNSGRDTIATRPTTAATRARGRAGVPVPRLPRRPRPRGGQKWKEQPERPLAA